MAKQTINIGSSANKGDGDPLRTAFTKVNNNFTELYDRAVNTDAQTLTLTGDTLSISGGNSVDLSKYVDSTFSGDYDDLTNKPTIPADIRDLTDTGNLLSAGAADSLTSNNDINITINNDDSSTYVWNFGNTGDLTAPGDITTGLVNTGGRFIQDCADGITSIRWVNVDQGDPVQIIRVYSDDPKVNNDTAFERAQIGINWSASQVQSGLTITSFDSTDPDSANQIEHTWQFQGDGALTFPDATVQTTAYPGPQNTLDGNSISIGRVDAGEVDIYGDVEFNNGVTAFQPGNSVSFNGPVNFTNATVTGLSIAPQTSLDGDVTGSVFSDGSTLLVDGVAGKIVGDVETARLRTSETTIALGGGAGLTTQGVRAVAIGEEAGRTDQGVRAVAIGYYAGQTNQSPTAVAIGDEAGQNTQGIRAVAIGYLAGGENQSNGAIAIGDEAGENTQGESAVAIGGFAGENTQGLGAVAVGFQAGKDAQGQLSVAVGIGSGQDTQGVSAVAVGWLAGQTNQGADAVAVGRGAGRTNQAENSIVINATGGDLNNTVADTFVVKPVRAATGTSILQYDATTGEITHTNEISSDQQISITVAGEDSTSKTWYFGNDGDLSLPGRLLLNSGGVQETFQPKVDATGVVTHDCALGHIFYHTSPDANWTANFINLDLGTSTSTNLVLVIEQGATPYYPSAVQIGGAAQTIKWLGNVTPTPSANKTEIATFTIFNSGSGFTVLGSYSTYG